MSSCCGGGSPKGKRGEEEKAQAIRNPESTPEHEGHDHAGCGMEGGLMKWLLLGLLIYLAVSYVRSTGPSL
ncbi:MAG: hypothetical protein HY555_05900 [Euryarchaeota archaeon]|nr:hypothetical protein [Euryarchaeota archaeon]